MRRRTRSVLVLFLCLLVALPVAAARARGGPRDGDGEGSGVRVVRPGDSIQAAIDAARPGDTILVEPGRYAEALIVGTDDLTLKGSRGTVLTPPSPEDGGNLCTELSGEVNGICVLGEVDPATGQVDDPVEGPRISGFTVRGFPGTGIVAVGTDRLRAVRNRVQDNGGYGIFSLFSTRPVLAYNRASGNGDAGLYVGGRQGVDATVVANASWDNAIGIFLRDVSSGRVAGNLAARNCTGIWLLAGAPGPVTGWTVKGNLVRGNNRTGCGEGDEQVPSGTGILLTGASDNLIARNLVLGNRGDEPTSGGIVLVSAGGSGEAEGLAPSGNRVRRNVALGNRPFDLRWDRTGEGNRFAANRCLHSRPRRLCR